MLLVTTSTSFRAVPTHLMTCQLDLLIGSMQYRCVVHAELWSAMEIIFHDALQRHAGRRNAPKFERLASQVISNIDGHHSESLLALQQQHDQFGIQIAHPV